MLLVNWRIKEGCAVITYLGEDIVQTFLVFSVYKKNSFEKRMLITEIR